MNPFTRIAKPQTPADYQTNANWATFERMRCAEELAAYDRDKIRAPADLIADSHTARWVERELIGEARRARSHA